jgi:hypothetical protein
MSRLDIYRSVINKYKTENKKDYDELTKRVSEYKSKVIEKAKRDAAFIEDTRFGDESELTVFDYSNQARSSESELKLRDKWNANLIMNKFNCSEKMASRITTLLKKDDERLDEKDQERPYTKKADPNLEKY